MHESPHAWLVRHTRQQDERGAGKWNGNPYVPDTGGDGRVEDDGASYLLPYWMGRYHGSFAEAGER